MVLQISSELAVGLLMAASAVVGGAVPGLINLKAQQMTIEAQNTRASADYLLQKEADSLMELIEVAERCHALSYQSLSKSQSDGKVSDELRSDLHESVAEFEHAARTKTVFLEDEERKAVEEFLSTIQKSVEASRHFRTGRTDVAREMTDWDDFMKGFEELLEELRPVLRERIAELRD